MTMLRSVVLGCGSYLPLRVLPNSELSRMVDTSDADEVEAAELAGISVRAMPLYMTDPAATAAIARAAVDLATELSG